MNMPKTCCDVLVVGAGLAGLSVALSLPQHLRVIILAKDDLATCASNRAQGGIAAVGQLQLLQPFMGLALAAVLLHEQVSGSMLVVTLVAVVCVAGAKKYA